MIHRHIYLFNHVYVCASTRTYWLTIFLPTCGICNFYLEQVLDVPSTSPLSGYLSPGDAIVSLDGKRIHNEQDWMEITALIDEQTLQSSNLSKSFEGPATVHRMKGYCVPTFVVEEINRTFFIDNQSACPDDLAEFVAIQCFDPSKSDNVDIEDGLSRRQRRHCLNAKDVVELNKCGEGRVTEITKGRHYVNQNPLRSSLNAIISSTFSWIFLFVIFFS